MPSEIPKILCETLVGLFKHSSVSPSLNVNQGRLALIGISSWMGIYPNGVGMLVLGQNVGNVTVLWSPDGTRSAVEFVEGPREARIRIGFHASKSVLVYRQDVLLRILQELKIRANICKMRRKRAAEVYKMIRAHARKKRGKA